jgi:hypothetical protein
MMSLSLESECSLFDSNVWTVIIGNALRKVYRNWEIHHLIIVQMPHGIHVDLSAGWIHRTRVLCQCVRADAAAYRVGYSREIYLCLTMPMACLPSTVSLTLETGRLEAWNVNTDSKFWMQCRGGADKTVPGTEHRWGSFMTLGGRAGVKG